MYLFKEVAYSNTGSVLGGVKISNQTVWNRYLNSFYAYVTDRQRREYVFRSSSVCPSICCPLTPLLCVAMLCLFISGEILMKLATNIRHIRGHCRKGFFQGQKVKGQVHGQMN